MTTQKKLAKLEKILAALNSAVVAYSGGVDSSFLLHVAYECLGNRVLAVTAVSETYTKQELLFARKFCRQFHIPHKVIKTYELADKNFSDNPRNRCYFCKKELFKRLQALAKKYSYSQVIDASNFDDRLDMRPGDQAKKELGIRSPLSEVKLTKKEIRSVSKRMRLSSWNRPQMACLASRIQYENPITRKRLVRIEKAEHLLKKYFDSAANIRVRDYSDLARIEVDKKSISSLLKHKGFVRRLKNLGFRYITVDLEGFRSGSMNGG